MIDLTQVNEFIKVRLEDGVGNLIWQMNYLLNRLKANNLRVDPANLTTKLKCRVGANQGLSNSSTIPKSGKTKTIDQTIALKKGYAVIEIDGDAIRYTPGDPEIGFMGALSGELASLMDSYNRNVEVTLQGDGTGIRGTVTSATNTAGVSYDIVCTSPNFAWFEIGMIIDTVNTGTGAVTGKFEITGTDTATMTITADAIGAITTAGTDVITNQKEYNSCYMGLLGICDDGTNVQTLQGIDRAVYELWRGRLDDNGGALRALTKRMLDEMIIYCNRSGGADIVMTTETLIWAMTNLLEAQRTWQNVTELEGGFTGLKWGGKEVMANMYNRANTIWFLNSKKVQVRQLKNSPNGIFNAATFVQKGTGQDYFVADFTENEVESFKGLMRWDFQVVTDDAKAHGAIADVQP